MKMLKKRFVRSFLQGVVFSPLFLALTLTVYVSAGDNFERCIEESGGGTAVVLLCLEKELKFQEKNLESEFKKALKMLSSKRKKRLLKIQKAWRHYRDEKCAFFNHEYSGTGGREDELDCLIKETKRRIGELKELF